MVGAVTEMTIQEFSQLASALQSLCFVAAAIAAGVWAVFRFRLMQRAVPTIEMQASQAIHPDSPDPCVLVNVRIHNRGKRAEVLEASEIALHVAKAKVRAKGKMDLESVGSFNPENADPEVSISSHAVEPGSTFTLGFLVPLPTPGIYQFRLIRLKDTSG